MHVYNSPWRYNRDSSVILTAEDGCFCLTAALLFRCMLGATRNTTERLLLQPDRAERSVRGKVTEARATSDVAEKTLQDVLLSENNRRRRTGVIKL